MKTIPAVVCSFLCLCEWIMPVPAAEAPTTFKVSEFTFTRPGTWEWVDVSTSPMRKAQLKVSGKQRESAEVVFFYFGEGGAGGTQANIDRWFGQFKETKDKLNAKVEEATAGKHKVTFVQAEGTYMSGMIGTGHPSVAQPGSMLQGAILESAQGNVFIKMTGPAKLVKASQDTFRKMIRSATD